MRVLIILIDSPIISSIKDLNLDINELKNICKSVNNCFNSTDDSYGYVFTNLQDYSNLDYYYASLHNNFVEHIQINSHFHLDFHAKLHDMMLAHINSNYSFDLNSLHKNLHNIFNNGFKLLNSNEGIAFKYYMLLFCQAILTTIVINHSMMKVSAILNHEVENVQTNKQEEKKDERRTIEFKMTDVDSTYAFLYTLTNENIVAQISNDKITPMSMLINGVEYHGVKRSYTSSDVYYDNLNGIRIRHSIVNGK